MLGIPFFFLLVGGASCNWIDGSNDPTYSRLGFYVENMVCNADGSDCVHSYTMDISGREIVHNLTYKAVPYEFLFTSTHEPNLVKTGIRQDDPEPFRGCIEYQTTRSLGTLGILKMTKCLDNTFEGISLPAQCTKPIAISTQTAEYGDKKIRGAEVLYCEPKKE